MEQGRVETVSFTIVLFDIVDQKQWKNTPVQLFLKMVTNIWATFSQWLLLAGVSCFLM